MGYRLITQGVLIIAALVIVFAFAQPELEKIKEKETKLQQYTEAIDKVSQVNQKLRELVQKRDSFSRQDMQALEKFIPTEIDSLKIMSEIAGIFSSRDITVTTMMAQEMVNPMTDVDFEDSVLAQQVGALNLSYQDYEVVFIATYEEMRDILLLTEASNSLFEVVELTFEATNGAAVDEDGNVAPALLNEEGKNTYMIIFRTFGLPINTSA